jgi:hypothetical protein
VNQVLGNLVHLHYPGGGDTVREWSSGARHYLGPQPVFSEWRLQDGPGSSVTRLLVKYFLHASFFLHYPSVLMHFLSHILFCSYVFNCAKQATTRSTHLRSLTALLTRS